MNMKQTPKTPITILYNCLWIDISQPFYMNNKLMFSFSHSKLKYAYV